MTTDCIAEPIEQDYDSIYELVGTIMHPLASLPLNDDSITRVSHNAITELVNLTQIYDGDLVSNAIAGRMANVTDSLADEKHDPGTQMKLLDIIQCLEQSARLVLITNIHTGNINNYDTVH
ncbi:MAG: hypothetical protein V1838_01960 [Patescibacteria group bacterium]